MKSNSLIKIGSRLINLESIVSVDLNFCDDEKENGVAISLSDCGYHFFWDEETDMLRQYFLLGSRVRDLNSLFGNTTSIEGVEKW